jgi:signal transduction histidine kinase/ActR/RegA family two-component response regulator
MAGRWHINFQTRVLAPVMSIMVVLIVVPMALVSRRMSRQLETSAADMLTTADAVFLNLQSIRTKNLLRRYSDVPNEPRSKAVLGTGDPKTITVWLRDLLEEMESEVLVFANDSGESPGFASRDPQFPIVPFKARNANAIRRALQGQAGVETISLGRHLYDVFTIPVAVGDRVLGALTVGMELGDGVVQELKQITRSEILLVADGEIAASTLAPSSINLNEALRNHVPDRDAHPARARGHAGTLMINGEHFVVMAQPLISAGNGGNVNYVLLASYERPLRVLQSMQRSFLQIQLGGILFGGALIWWLVRRVTRPLRLLRDSAEAVGRGDFSRRVEVRSNDECGELASVFNQMTSNLNSSRQELEAAVSTLRSTQAQLIQSEKLRAIGTLAGGIAHDFNNILGAILGFSELVLDDIPSETRTGRNLRQVIKAGERAKDLVRQILAFSRQADPERVNVRLSAIIDETLKLLRASIPKTIEIKTVLLTQADTVVADPSQLHQVLMNLGTNACHAMGRCGGVLTVTLESAVVPERGSPEAPHLSSGPYLRLSVADTGHGMTPEVMARIFEPFFTTKPVGEGTGLGLSVVHGIIKSHCGEITVSSQLGVGTTFHVFLPSAQDLSLASDVTEEPLPGCAERILVVDDEEPLVNVMQQKLTRLGYEVVAHCDSLAAWREFQAAPERFDLMIADQTMPHLTGDDLARRIHGLRAGMPIIICSGSGQAFGQAPGLCPGVLRLVSKPVNYVELSRCLREVLERPPAPELDQSKREEPILT